jgi:hypothetical protein
MDLGHAVTIGAASIKRGGGLDPRYITACHEAAHAIGSLAVGGTVEHISINANGGGEFRSRAPPPNWDGSAEAEHAVFLAVRPNAGQQR